jgi:hypothetical protein
MKILLCGAALALVSLATAAAQGDHYVQGYYRSNGAYVAPHYQTNPNNTRADNYSTEGNVNPYTGEPGTKPLYPTAPAYTPYVPPPAPSSYGIYRPMPQTGMYGSSYGQPAPARRCTSSYGC